MKNTVIITAEELQSAALHLMMQKPQFWGKHVATVEFVFDKSDPVPSRQIRAEVVLFDTEHGAKRYLAGKGDRGDEIAAEYQATEGGAASTVDPDPANILEGVEPK